MSNNKSIGSTETILADPQFADVSPSQVEENLRLIEDLKFFLATAPANWQKNQIIRRYYLNHDEGFVSCVFWNNLYFITGTDIVRCIVYRFEQFGREITDRKKFEEGIFSDLRSLKCGSDAVLEASKSPFLEFLYKNSCLRTQKKQKVFFWFSVPHDKLFADALERDLKKESTDQVGTTRSKTEPSLSFSYDVSEPLYEQLVDHLALKKRLYASSEISSMNDDILPEHPTSSQTTDIEPQTFYIKEEQDNQFNVISQKGEDDFPLDYFPIHESNQPMMIDPSVFMNPPDSYNDQYLIDQTYAKTPYNEVNFETDESEEPYVPVSAYRPGLYPPPSQHFYVNPYGHPQQGGAYPMTNGQYYDQQEEEGEDEEQIRIEAPQYAPNGYYAATQSFGNLSAAQYYYEGQQLPPQAHYYPAFIDEMPEEGDDELYSPFAPQVAVPQFSPFSQGFPSFQAAAPAPPVSASRLRHQVYPPPPQSRGSGVSGGPRAGRVMKPGRASAPFKQSGALRKVELDFEQRKRPSSTLTQQESSKASSSRDLESRNEDEDYNSLPTPESTAPDPWHYGNSSHASHNNNDGNNNNNINSNNDNSNHGNVKKEQVEESTDGLNDFLEDKIYEEADDKE